MHESIGVRKEIRVHKGWRLFFPRHLVIPAQAGIQIMPCIQLPLDSRLRGNDGATACGVHAQFG
jgi:hypothetical protein